MTTATTARNNTQEHHMGPVTDLDLRIAAALGSVYAAKGLSLEDLNARLLEHHPGRPHVAKVAAHAYNQHQHRERAIADALAELGFDSPEPRNRDRLDFRDCHVSNVRAALERLADFGEIQAQRRAEIIRDALPQSLPAALVQPRRQESAA